MIYQELLYDYIFLLRDLTGLVLYNTSTIFIII